MNGWVLGSFLYSGGALITCLWLARAMKLNRALRRRHEDVAELVGWPLVALANVLCWPFIVLHMAIWGEPDEGKRRG